MRAARVKTCQIMVAMGLCIPCVPLVELCRRLRPVVDTAEQVRRGVRTSTLEGWTHSAQFVAAKTVRGATERFMNRSQHACCPC